MKRGEILSREEVVILEHLIKSLEEAYTQLEFFYSKKDQENFARVKHFISQVQKKISRVIE